ncbi:hypothetical protein [Anabaena lutea]|uniref:Transposase n=1 Tax=Anabaena lutea FACHB-196 TaxID=2692881 RepID=A0ABR8FJL7_9NOST|nr:hypothetical protein [Anabaena lutea]MBD2569969.1 hypothetical protein [Anabaena lutea FACHB-196]
MDDEKWEIVKRSLSITHNTEEYRLNEPRRREGREERRRLVFLHWEESINDISQMRSHPYDAHIPNAIANLTASIALHNPKHRKCDRSHHPKHRKSDRSYKPQHQKSDRKPHCKYRTP